MAVKRTRDDVINLRRTQLIQAAYRVVGSKGFYNFTVKDLAAEAGLSTGLVHYYFRDKQELLLSLLKHMNTRLKTYLSEALAASVDPAEKLGIFISQAFNLVKKNRAYFSIIFDFWTQVNRNERMRKANIRLFQSYRDECSAILREGVRSGAFRQLDIEYTTAWIISLVQGMIVQHVIDGMAFDYDEYTARLMGEIRERLRANGEGG